MVNRRKDITGKTFNRLFVLKYTHTNCRRMACYDVKCKCGVEFNTPGRYLINKHCQSCGCYNSEIASKTCKKVRTTHGLTETKEYRAWVDMKTRCYNSNHNRFENYGGRGIIVCNEWLESFENFYNHVGKATTSKHSIDRINVNGNYEPGNVRWATSKEQRHNRQDSI